MLYHGQIYWLSEYIWFALITCILKSYHYDLCNHWSKHYILSLQIMIADFAWYPAIWLALSYNREVNEMMIPSLVHAILRNVGVNKKFWFSCFCYMLTSILIIEIAHTRHLWQLGKTCTTKVGQKSILGGLTQYSNQINGNKPEIFIQSSLHD